MMATDHVSKWIDAKTILAVKAETSFIWLLFLRKNWKGHSEIKALSVIITHFANIVTAGIDLECSSFYNHKMMKVVKRANQSFIIRRDRWSISSWQNGNTCSKRPSIFWIYILIAVLEYKPTFINNTGAHLLKYTEAWIKEHPLSIRESQ